LEARNGTRTKVVTTRSESYKGEGTGEPYERVEVVDDRITRVAERGGEVPGGPAERDGGGEHRPEREEKGMEILVAGVGEWRPWWWSPTGFMVGAGGSWGRGVTVNWRLKAKWCV
jgi:hypothetical protein